MRGMSTEIAVGHAVALVTCLLATGTVSAVTTDPIPAHTKITNAFTNFDTSTGLSFPKFDPAAGQTLTAVTLDLTGTLKTTLTVTAGASGATVAYGEAKLLMFVQDAGNHLATSALPLTGDPTNCQILPMISTLKTAQTLAPNQSFQWNNLTASDSMSERHTESAILDEFTNKGNGAYIFLRVATATSTGAFWNNGNATASQTSTASVSGTVTYEYEYAAVPEAATMLLGGMAVMPMLMQRRRERNAETPVC